MKDKLTANIKTIADAHRLLADENWLADNLPEVLSLKNCVQLGPHHQEGDVFTHTEEVVKNLPATANPELLWAGILHDIAKPLTRVERERNGEIITQFFNHEVLGAEMAEKITARLGLSVKEREKIKWLVRNHMRIFVLPEMGEKKARNFVDHEYFPELWELLKADLAASWARDEAWERKKRELLARIEETINSYK
jgi:poly(A) polymerase